MANTIRGLLPDGTLPTTALEQVQGIVDGIEVPAGNGIQEVEGAVSLPTDGPRVVELYTVGDTTIGPETFPVDTAVVARRRADGVWERWVVGYDSGWREFGAANPDPPRSVTPDAPEFVDLSGTAQDVTIIPAVTGVQYLIDGVPVASGSHPSSGTVTVDAVAADESVTIEGTASWTHEFSTGVVQEWGTRAHHATFTQADTNTVGIYHDPTRPSEYPPVYTDESGGVWNAGDYHWLIRSGALASARSNSRAWVEHGQSGGVSVRATVTNGANGRIYAQVNGPLANAEPQGVYMTFEGATMSLIGLVDSTSYNKDGGTGTTALIPDYDPATPYRLRLDVVGDQAMVFVDDVHYMTGTIRPSRIAEAGGRRFLGLAAQAKDALVDDVEVWVP